MPRIHLPPDNALTADQRRVVDATIAGKRGRVPAPLTAWIASPTLADRAQSLGEFLRYDTSLGPRLSELAILVTASFWQAEYEWVVHKRDALRAGLEPDIVDAIERGVQPIFTAEADAAVYQFAWSVHHDHRVTPELYARAVNCLGERGTVELVGIIGYYSLVAMTLNVFEIGTAC